MPKEATSLPTLTHTLFLHELQVAPGATVRLMVGAGAAELVN